MAQLETYQGNERRTRDRSRGIVLRRRRSQPVDPAQERRRTPVQQNGFDIAAALELHLDQCSTRRAMLTLLESWLREANEAGDGERDEGYIRAVQNATEVIKNSPDVQTGIAILQRRPEDS